MTETTKRPKVSSEGQRELDKAQENFDVFESSVKAMTLDRMNAAPKQDLEPQTKLAQSEIADAKDIYLKPKKTIGSKEQFNEKFRSNYEYDKEYVYFIAENKEIIGETLDFWTKPYPGMPAEEWEVPVNTPIWAPRYVAEQISRKFYHRLVMKENTTSSDGRGTYYGQMAADTTVARLEARPATKRKSIFMGANKF